MIKIIFAMIFAAVLPVAMVAEVPAQAEAAPAVVEAEVSRVTVAQYCESPKSVATTRRPVTAKSLAPVSVAQTKREVVLPAVGWPDSIVWTLGGAVLVLALIIAFLLGRVTAPVATQPQVMAPVVYVHPPLTPPAPPSAP